MNFKKSLYVVATSVTLLIPFSLKAWSDGSGWANYAYLVKIYLENVKRYHQVNMMIDQQNKYDQYIRILNGGLNNASGLIQALPVKDERILAQLRDFQSALRKVEEIYGLIPKSSDAALQRLHDETIAESLKMSNSIKDYTDRQELNATNVFIQSSSASPKGAERMNAQTSAQILHSVNQLIKVNGQLLKLQSESFALTNKGGKDSTEGFNKAKHDLEMAMKKMKPQFDFPRF